MQSYEYKVIPAPARGEKERGLKTGAEKFAHTLTQVMNDLAREGWEYWRAETLPAEERSGLTSKTTVYHNLLVFRRAAGERAAPTGGEPLVTVDAMEAAAKRLISAIAPEGRAPRLGPAEDAAPVARTTAKPEAAEPPSPVHQNKADLIRAELTRGDTPRLSPKPATDDKKGA